MRSAVEAASPISQHRDADEHQSKSRRLGNDLLCLEPRQIAAIQYKREKTRGIVCSKIVVACDHEQMASIRKVRAEGQSFEFLREGGSG